MLQGFIRKFNVISWNSEKYSRGRRGAPAKGVGRVTGARVQIPPSPPIYFITMWSSGVVVNMPPCHGGDREFDPRLDRHYFAGVVQW